MRIALISDIHGNLRALEAVLADIEREAPDGIVCLGDLAAMGPRPAEATARVMALGCPVVQGNTDDWLANGLPDPPPGDERARRTHDVNAWCALQLTGKEETFLRGLPATHAVDLDGVTLGCYHGSPRSHMEQTLPTTPDEALAEWFAGVDAPLLAGGHTHRQMLRRWNGRTIINPGSVGLTFERFPAAARGPRRPWAEYALASVDQGEVRVDFRLVPFDLAALADDARASGMPHAEWWIEGWGA